MDMVDRHVAHEHNEADPWHERSLDEVGDRICHYCGNHQRLETGPEGEEADEVEHRDADDEGVLAPWCPIWDPLE